MRSQKAVPNKKRTFDGRKLPKGWRKDHNAVPLPFSRPWAECKNSEAVGIVSSMGPYIEEVGLEYLLEHLECVCDEQAGLYYEGCGDVFPKNPALAGIWAVFAKNFRDMHKFTLSYAPTKKEFDRRTQAAIDAAARSREVQK